jgi:hypothetical protein
MSECSRWQPSDWCTHGHHSHQPHRAAAWQWLCDKHHAEVSDPPTNIRDTPVPKPLTDGHESVTMQAGPTNSVQSLALLHAPMPGNQAHPRMSLSHQGSLSRCPASDTTERLPSTRQGVAGPGPAGHGLVRHGKAGQAWQASEFAR